MRGNSIGRDGWGRGLPSRIGLEWGLELEGVMVTEMHAWEGGTWARILDLSMVQRKQKIFRLNLRNFREVEAFRDNQKGGSVRISGDS